MLNTAINRITSGAINQVNDAVVGMPAAPLGLGLSKFAGQLGNGFWMDDNDLAFSTTVGTVYAGHFRYVRLAAAATTPVVVGQMVFWDTLANATDNLYQVTTAESGTTNAAVWQAGIVLNSSWTAGNYSVIQDFGLCYVKFRAALTGTGHPGSMVVTAGAGGADLGFMDVPAAGAVTDVGLTRYIGKAVDTPTNGGLKRIYLNILGGLRG